MRKKKKESEEERQEREGSKEEKKKKGEIKGLERQVEKCHYDRQLCQPRYYESLLFYEQEVNS